MGPDIREESGILMKVSGKQRPSDAERAADSKTSAGGLLLHGIFHFIEQGDDMQGISIEALPCVGQAEPVGAAFKKPDAVTALKLFDSKAYGRLRNIERSGRSSQISLFTDSKKNAQMSDCHDSLLWISRYWRDSIISKIIL